MDCGGGVAWATPPSATSISLLVKSTDKIYKKCYNGFCGKKFCQCIKILYMEYPLIRLIMNMRVLNHNELFKQMRWQQWL